MHCSKRKVPFPCIEGGGAVSFFYGTEFSLVKFPYKDGNCSILYHVTGFTPTQTWLPAVNNLVHTAYTVLYHLESDPNPDLDLNL
jgi:hypothetical protein